MVSFFMDVFAKINGTIPTCNNPDLALALLENRFIDIN